jgi:hypothetical protein
MMDNRGRLMQSPHTAAKSVGVFGYAGIGDELSEGQASVSLPRYGSRPELNAPFLPSKKVKQLLSVLSTLKDVDLTDLSYEINCYVPRQQRYRQELDLPIALALLCSYLRRNLPERSLFVGELDLTRRIRAPEPLYLAALAQLVASPQRRHLTTVFLSLDCCDDSRKMRPEPEGKSMQEIVDVRGFDTLESLLVHLWPDLISQE